MTMYMYSTRCFFVYSIEKWKSSQGLSTMQTSQNSMPNRSAPAEAPNPRKDNIRSKTSPAKCYPSPQQEQAEQKWEAHCPFSYLILHPLFESENWILLSAKTACSVEMPPWKSTKLSISIVVYWIRIPLCTLQEARIISNWISAEPWGLLKSLCHIHEHFLQLLHAIAFVLSPGLSH